MQTEIIPFVQDVSEDAQKTAAYWDNIATQAENLRCRSMLTYGEALYNLEKDKGYTELGFGSIHEYVYERFGRSREATNKTIAVYRKYVVELGRSIDELVAIGIGKLSQMCAHVTHDSIEQDLIDMGEMSQKEISEKLKSEGSDQSDDEKKEEQKLVFKGPATMVEVVKAALGIASDIVSDSNPYFDSSKDVPPLLALEMICSIFMSSADLEGEAYATLDTAIKQLENVFNVKITVEPKND